jgi:transposase-like protein
MDKNKYHKYVTGLNDLSPEQYRNLKDNIETIDQKKKVANMLEKGEVINCPYCSSKDFIKNGVRDDLQRYQCKSCGKNYNILTGTPLAGLRKKGRWLNFCECLSNSISVRKAAVLTGVDNTTSFGWRHRFLKNANQLKPKSLSGVSESIETSFKYSEKGTTNIKHKELIGKDIYVGINKDRARNTFDSIIVDLKSSLLEKHFSTIFPKDILFCSSNNNVYKSFVKKQKLVHGSLNISKGEFKRKEVVHIENARKYKKDLHDWMYRFRGVATKYLGNYLSWFREQDEYLNNIPPKVLLLRAKSLDKYKYQPLTQT